MADTPEEDGIIPAYAGSTLAGASDCVFLRDHPRIRGEHSRERPGSGSLLGSSPHTRGARAVDGDLQEFSGIIPAYAGSTLLTCRLILELAGSSPHTRGALASAAAGAGAAGIIPAYAGSTILQGSEVVALGDHPRIRGEHR